MSQRRVWGSGEFPLHENEDEITYTGAKQSALTTGEPAVLDWKDNWKRICEEPLFGFLKHDCRDILGLLFDQEISVGKAAQSIAERKLGIEPQLPAPRPDSSVETPVATPEDLFRWYFVDEPKELRELDHYTQEAWDALAEQVNNRFKSALAISEARVAELEAQVKTLKEKAEEIRCDFTCHECNP